VKVAVYPGSFDPITFGHLDIIGRAAKVFDRVIVGVLENPRKQPLLPVAQRIDVIRAARDEHCPADADRITIESFVGLTVEFCRAREAGFIIRGLRAISDFETELQLGHANRALAADIDTVFFMTSLEQGFVSSSLVKEIAQFGGPIDRLVPAQAAEAVRTAFRARGMP
jgi:pantetheine-phosphate adenylyltransferase